MAYELHHPDDLGALVGAYEEVMRAGVPAVPGAADIHLRDLRQVSDLSLANWQLVQGGVGILRGYVSDQE